MRISGLGSIAAPRMLVPVLLLLLAGLRAAEARAKASESNLYSGSMRQIVRDHSKAQYEQLQLKNPCKKKPDPNACEDFDACLAWTTSDKLTNCTAVVTADPNSCLLSEAVRSECRPSCGLCGEASSSQLLFPSANIPASCPGAWPSL